MDTHVIHLTRTVRFAINVEADERAVAEESALATARGINIQCYHPDVTMVMGAPVLDIIIDGPAVDGPAAGDPAAGDPVTEQCVEPDPAMAPIVQA